MDRVERTSETERRRATVVFADITGFTALNERRDPEEAYSIVTDCLKRLDAIARSHGGSVDKYLGDCIMVVFGVPTAIEDTEKAAINAAIEMHNSMKEFNARRVPAETLELHTGINSGLVISGDISGPVLREFSVMGDVVNIASRLKDLAPPGQIWVGSETYRNTQEEFEFRALDRLTMKGKQQPVAVYEVLSRAERLHRRSPVSRMAVASEFVGRGEEFEALRRRIAMLDSGQGGVATVVGEAGIGKSRLIAQLAASEEASSALWLQGRSLSVGANLSFHPFSDLFRSWAKVDGDASSEDARARVEGGIRELFGDGASDVLAVVASLVGLREPAGTRERSVSLSSDAMEKMILGVTSRFLRIQAQRGPVILVLEDLHWADTSSLELLVPLLRLAADHRILFVMVLRPEPASVLDRVRAAVEPLDAAIRDEMRLSPLDRGRADELIDSLFRHGDLPHAARILIEERTGGNPFYLHEVVRSLIDEGAVEVRDGALWATEKIESVEIPGTVHEVIMARLDRLPLETKSVLQVAAIIGRSADARILSSVLDRDPSDDLAALVSAEQLVQRERLGEPVYEFKHPLIQEVAYGVVTRAKRAKYHRRVADAIERELGPGHPSYYGMLAYHYGLGDDPAQAEKYLLLAGEQAAELSASTEALELLQDATRRYFQIHGEGGEPRRKALLEKKIGLAFFNRGRMVEGDEHFDRALELLGSRVPRTKLGRNVRWGVSLLAVLADLYTPRVLRRRRRPTAEDHDLIDITWARAQAQVTSDPTRFLFDSMEGLRQLNRVDPTSVRRAGGQYAGAAGMFAYSGLSFGIGERFLARAEALVNADDAREMLLAGMMNFAHRFLQGDWDDRHGLDEVLVEENIRLGELWNVINYLPLDAKRKLHQGRFLEAAAELEQIAKIADLYAYDLGRSNQLAVTMFLQLECRRLPEALAAANAYYDEFDDDLLNLLGLGTRAKIEILLDDLEAAERSLELAQHIVRRAGILPTFHHSAFLVSRFRLDLAQLERALAGGDRKLARSLHRRTRRDGKRALAKARKVAWHRPETHGLLARLAWLTGRRGKALDRWGRSVEEAEKLGMRPDLGRSYLEIGCALRGVRKKTTFRGLDANACFERAREIFEALDLTWDLERLAAARKGISSATTRDG